MSVSNREEGHSASARPYLNTAGKIYLTFICLYTLFILYGLVLLFRNRSSTAVRIRGFFHLFLAIIAVHVYLAAVFVVYPLNGWYKCSTEFWYMSVVFPLGIAIFQVTNVRLLAYAKKQQNLIAGECWAERKRFFELRTRAGIIAWLRQSDWVSRSYVCICVGLIIQLLVTLVLFFGSRRFNLSTGFFGEHVGPVECRRGAEWIPSVVWQFVSTWIVGPWVLFRSRNIKDTHYWTLQTRLVILASLLGTPLWIAFLYSNDPAVQAVSAWWPPAMWFAPGLIMMQITSIVLPLWDVCRNGNRAGSKRSSFIYPESYISSEGPSVSTLLSSDQAHPKDVSCHYEALQFQVRRRITPLANFAARRDFTAENIQFLREVKDFKRKWRPTNVPAVDLLAFHASQLDMYLHAARIFFELVHTVTASCSINIDSKIYSALKYMFRGLRYEPPTASSSKRPSTTDSDAAPWESLEHLIPPPRALTAADKKARKAAARAVRGAVIMRDMFHLGISGPTTSIPLTDMSAPSTASVATPPSAIGTVVFDRAGGGGGVPPAFNVSVFDAVEESIKYLVFTNTWKRFVSSAAPREVISIHESGTSRYFAARGLSPAGLHEFRKEAGEDGYHHGTVRCRGGPVAYEQVDAECAHCKTHAELPVSVRRASERAAHAE